MKGNSYTEFTDVTDEWLPDNIKYCTVVWVILKDIDQNGQLDLTEYAKTTYKHGSLPTTNCLEEAWRWEWNGSSFTTISTTQLSVDDEILENSLKLYPNPVTNILTIESKNVTISKVEIYSILGKKIKEINSNFGSITTDNLPNGIYIIRIYSEKGMVMKKTIKM